MREALLLGRILFSMIFILSGFSHFTEPVISFADKQGVPFASFLVPFSGLLAILGGLSIALGYYAKVGGWLLTIFLVPVTLKMHAFWTLADPGLAQVQQVMFLKNLSMLGGALTYAYFGSGPYSLQSRKRLMDETDVSLTVDRASRSPQVETPSTVAGLTRPKPADTARKTWADQDKR